MGDSHPSARLEIWSTVANSNNWCDALYFPHGRRKLGGVHCRLELGHPGDHWCEAEDENAEGEPES